MATKVFVGNLSFKIQQDKLREEFSAAGNVLSANIITRGPRSLGYGFVEFASREEAEKSVDLLNHKDIDGREINVEVAKPRAEPPVRQPAERRQEDQDQGGQRPPRQRRRNAPNSPGGNNNVQGGPPSRPKGGRGPQASEQPRRTYRPRNQNNQADNAGGSVEGQGNNNNNNNAGRNVSNNTNHNQGDDVNDSGRSVRRRRRNPNRGPRQDQGQSQQPPQQSLQPQQQQPQQQFRRKRPAPQPRVQQEKIKSPTTLFVANLPFAVDDKELAEIFSNKWKVVKAHVVKKRNTRSKGFGFVEFENEADQQAALKEFDGFSLHERALSIKVALTPVPDSPEKEASAEGDAPNAASAPESGEKGEHAGEKGGAAEAETKEAKPEAAAGDENKGGQ